MGKNLHNLQIETDETGNGIPLSDFSTSINKPTFDFTEVIFRNTEERLIELINEYKNDIIFGCVAWLTSIPILKALAKCKNVQIIVQKEDFLRPDLDTTNYDTWKETIQINYKNLKFELERHQCNEPICHLSVCGDPTVDPIRCLGNHNSSKIPAFPRAHHKFLVFCKLENKKYITEKLWTGSFNLTYNATMSFENVIVLTDKSGENEILNAFLNEHHQLFALSEPLDWKETWVTPEFRIGT